MSPERHGRSGSPLQPLPCRPEALQRISERLLEASGTEGIAGGDGPCAAKRDARDSPGKTAPTEAGRLCPKRTVPSGRTAATHCIITRFETSIASANTLLHSLLAEQPCPLNHLWLYEGSLAPHPVQLTALPVRCPWSRCCRDWSHGARDPAPPTPATGGTAIAVATHNTAKSTPRIALIFFILPSLLHSRLSFFLIHALHDL